MKRTECDLRYKRFYHEKKKTKNKFSNLSKKSLQEEKRRFSKIQAVLIKIFETFISNFQLTSCGKKTIHSVIIQFFTYYLKILFQKHFRVQLFQSSMERNELFIYFRFEEPQPTSKYELHRKNSVHVMCLLEYYLFGVLKIQ